MNRTFVVLFVTLSLLATATQAQDGTRGYTVTTPGQFLIPTKEMRNQFTLGARKPLQAGTVGLDFAYNCTNGVFDWGRIGGVVCSLAETQSPIDINELVVAPVIVNDAANALHVDFNSAVWMVGNEYLLNITAATTTQQQKQQQIINNNITKQKNNTSGNNKTTTKQQQQDNNNKGNEMRKSRVLWREDGLEFGERQEFVLDSVVFHSPAEHTIRGIRFGMEVQFYLTAANGSRLAIAVLGRVSEREFVSEGMFQTGKLIEKELASKPTALLELNPSVFMPRLEGFWKYKGSTTTPPCTTDVNWLVMHHPVNITEKFSNVVRELVDSRYRGGNARVTQEKTTGFKVTSYRTPPFAGELLFESSTTLTPNLRKFANNNKINNSTSKNGALPNHVAWAKEPNVVDIAQSFVESLPEKNDQTTTTTTTTTTTNSVDSSEDPWGAILNGRKLARDNGADKVPRMIPTADSNIRSTIMQQKYNLFASCDRQYTFENRFVPYGQSPLKQNTTGIYVAPPIAPGSHLLTETPVDKFHVSAEEIRDQVEQATRRAGEVVRILPADLV